MAATRATRAAIVLLRLAVATAASLATPQFPPDSAPRVNDMSKSTTSRTMTAAWRVDISPTSNGGYLYDLKRCTDVAQANDVAKCNQGYNLVDRLTANYIPAASWCGTHLEHVAAQFPAERRVARLSRPAPQPAARPPPSAAARSH